MVPMETLLGKSVATPLRYAPGLLQRVARYSEGTEGGAPHGVDVWHAYEASCLSETGIPTVCILKFVYPSSSMGIVESKSLKLYLNSLNNEFLGATPEEARGHLVERVQHDLSQLLGVNVECHAHMEYTGEYDFTNYSSVDVEESCAPPQDAGNEIAYCSTLLRSRCPVTGQPDWGNLFVRMRGVCLPSHANLRDYVVGLREQQHFHEAICDATYGYLWKRFAPEKLMVSCLYTRRGGIDICPVRSSDPSWLPRHLAAADRLTAPAWRQ